MRVGVEGTVDMLVRGEKNNRPNAVRSRGSLRQCNFFLSFSFFFGFILRSAFLWHSV